MPAKHQRDDDDNSNNNNTKEELNSVPRRIQHGHKNNQGNQREKMKKRNKFALLSWPNLRSTCVELRVPDARRQAAGHHWQRSVTGWPVESAWLLHPARKATTGNYSRSSKKKIIITKYTHTHKHGHACVARRLGWSQETWPRRTGAKRVTGF